MPSPTPDLSPILQALTRLAADGAPAQSRQAGAGDQARFMAQGQLPLDALSVQVQGVGALSQPVLPEQGARLHAVTLDTWDAARPYDDDEPEHPITARAGDSVAIPPARQHHLELDETATFAVEAAWHYLAAERLGIAPVPMAQMLERQRDDIAVLFARRFGLSMDESALAATLLLSGLNEESLARLEAASQAP